MASQTSLPFTFNEQVSAEISWSFQDGEGDAVAAAALSSVTMTLYDLMSKQVINGRDEQDILGPDRTGTNDVSISSVGAATWYVQPEDNAIIIAGSLEQHIALIEWTWDPEDGHGVRQGKFEIPILVKDLNMVS